MAVDGEERNAGAPPRVSVIIPTHNSAPTIGRALASVLSQSYQPFEIIVVDDGSGDDTVRIVEADPSPQIRVMRLTECAGAAGARNAGIEAASGELVAFLDADDAWHPAKLERQVALIQSSDRYVFVACASEEFAVDGEDLGDTFRGRRPLSGPDGWKGLLACNTVATPTVLVWRRHLVELGGFNRALEIGEDQDMWIRLALRGEIGYLPECLAYVYTRANSLSDRGFREHIAVTLRMVEGHVAALRDRLTAAEIRAIRGERIGRIGRIACAESYIAGVGLVLRAALLGYQPIGSLAFVLRASPPARWLKRHIRAMVNAIGNGGRADVRPSPPQAPLRRCGDG